MIMWSAVFYYYLIVIPIFVNNINIQIIQHQYKVINKVPKDIKWVLKRLKRTIRIARMISSQHKNNKKYYLSGSKHSNKTKIKGTKINSR
jgi:hypothetical protein